MINVEDHAEHCRMAREVIIMCIYLVHCYQDLGTKYTFYIGMFVWATRSEIRIVDLVARMRETTRRHRSSTLRSRVL